MAIREEFKAILALECMTMTELARLASEKGDKKYTMCSISEKLLRGTIKYEEVRFLAEILGYKVKLEKK